MIKIAAIAMATPTAVKRVIFWVISALSEVDAPVSGLLALVSSSVGVSSAFVISAAHREDGAIARKRRADFTRKRKSYSDWSSKRYFCLASGYFW